MYTDSLLTKWLLQMLANIMFVYTSPPHSQPLTSVNRLLFIWGFFSYRKGDGDVPCGKLNHSILTLFMGLLVDYNESRIPCPFHFSKKTKVMMIPSPVQHLPKQHIRIIKNPQMAVTSCHLAMPLIALTLTCYSGGKKSLLKLIQNTEGINSNIDEVGDFYGAAITLQQVWIWKQGLCQELLFFQGFSKAVHVCSLSYFVSF